MSEQAQRLLSEMKTAYETSGQTRFDDIQFTTCPEDVFIELYNTGYVERENTIIQALIYIP